MNSMAYPYYQSDVDPTRELIIFKSTNNTVNKTDQSMGRGLSRKESILVLVNNFMS